MFSSLCNASLILYLLRSLALASVVSCVENNTHLAPFHNSFGEKQVSGLVFTLHNGVAAASRQSHPPFHHLPYTHTKIGMAASVHALMQICKHAQKRMPCTQVVTNIFLRLAPGHLFLATKVIPTDKHILITWGPVTWQINACSYVRDILDPNQVL